MVEHELGALALRDEFEERLGRGLVAAERPDARDVGQVGQEAARAGPAGIGTVQQFSATCGASRFATAQAEGGLKISAERPEISARLFDASSHAQTSFGRKRDSRTA